MRFEINFDHLPEYVLIKTYGEASADGFDKLLTEIVNSPKWKTGVRQLIDHRELNAQNLGSADILRIKDIVIKHSTKLGNGNCAFVIKDDLGFGFIRMYELLGGDELHQEMSVFYTIEEATGWLLE